MPRFTPDLASKDATTPVYDKGLYQVKIVSTFPRIYLNRDDEVRAVVRCRLEMVGQVDDEGEVQTEGLEGRPVAAHNLWLHTEKTGAMNKQFLMAALGYNPRDAEAEAEFNNEVLSEHEDWIDGEPDDEESWSCGDIYDLIEGRIVNVYLDQDVYEDQPQQTHGGWSPVE